jgi:N-acetylneuraminic acid mutarotase
MVGARGLYSREIVKACAVATLGALFCLAGTQAWAADISISKSGANATVSWTGPGRLQAAPAISGPWTELLEVTNSYSTGTTNSQRFFGSLNRWSTRASLLASNSEMAVAELNGKIYVMGGYPPSRITVNTVQVYDPSQNAWQFTTPMPLAVNHSMPASVNGKIYVIGGQTNDASSGSFVSTVFEFDPTTTNWTTKAPMPTQRSAGACAVIGNLIYVAGGRPPQGNDFAVYDLLANQWTTLTNMPTARNHIAAAAIGGKVYVAGGRLGAGFSSAMTNVLEVYDPALSAWSTKAPMLEPRGGLNGIAVNGLFFTFGGEGPNGVFNNNEMYSPVQNRWYRLQPLPVAVHGVTGAAFANGWIHLPGGGTAQGGSSGSTIHQVFLVQGIAP